MQTFNPYTTSSCQKLSMELCNILLTYNQSPIFVCLGTSSIIADSLGPIVGELLTKKYNLPTIVYGNISHNITQKNIQSYFNHIKQQYPKRPIIVVDACLSSFDQIGNIQLKKGAIYSTGFLSANFKTTTNTKSSYSNNTNLDKEYIKNVNIQTKNLDRYGTNTRTRYKNTYSYNNRICSGNNGTFHRYNNSVNCGHSTPHHCTCTKRSRNSQHTTKTIEKNTEPIRDKTPTLGRYCYGDYALLGVVNTLGINSLVFLKSVTLSTVLKQAGFIAKSIYYAYELYLATTTGIKSRN